MNSVSASDAVGHISLQAASQDIWDKKYRLKDHGGNPVDITITDTFSRVARALARVEREEIQDDWYARFLWAMQNGAIPAGRILSNAGAEKYKPATSTINCTVSRAIRDSMDHILGTVHQAGLTLKAGSGVGYEFSTLRPRGDYVSGAGAFTSGPLSFMDVFDKMCFTVSSAGGRRGAQMATFDVSHPDVFEFIQAKREDGRLRQFNLSLLITQDFIEAVKGDADWALVFPATPRQIEAEGLDINNPDQIVWRKWPITDEYRVNDRGEVACKVHRKVKARVLWETIMRSTYEFAEPGFLLIDQANTMNNNWFCEFIRASNPCVTADTWVQTSEGPRQVADLVGKAFHARVNGVDHVTGKNGFFRTATKAIVKLTTVEGYELRLTADHRVLVALDGKADAPTEWRAAGELKQGDLVVLHNHRSNTAWEGSKGFEQGRHAGFAIGVGAVSTITPAIEKTSSDFHRGFLCGLFDSSGSIHGLTQGEACLRLRLPCLEDLKATQRMLLRLGVVSSIDQSSSEAGQGSPLVMFHHTLVISGTHMKAFQARVDLTDEAKAAHLDLVLKNNQITPNKDRFTVRVEAVTYAGVEDVYDVQVPGPHAFDANGIYAHNCGEQLLPEDGACLLGSINLTKFVTNPFSENAQFNWDTYREVVKVFTRMLDNVVEINGLPLEAQRQEIARKRRHGMGYLGLGSTLTMLGMKYGSPQSLAFTDRVSRELAVAGWEAALELSLEKGPAPIMEETFTVTSAMLAERPEMRRDGYQEGDEIKGRVLHARYSRYMQLIKSVNPELVERLAEAGARFTHHTSIAPTGTISLSLGNNASNGIEPSFAHHYFRNVIREGRKTKERVGVFSFELLAYRVLVDASATPETLPDYFLATDDITPENHVDIQAAAQKWVDSSISKTINVPTDYPYERFKDIYLYAYEQGLKGCATFRFNPEVFQGVLVKEKDLKNTLYAFTLEDGSVVEVSGDQMVEYDGEVHTAANLFDALKEGTYGKY